MVIDLLFLSLDRSGQVRKSGREVRETEEDKRVFFHPLRLTRAHVCVQKSEGEKTKDVADGRMCFLPSMQFSWVRECRNSQVEKKKKGESERAERKRERREEKRRLKESSCVLSLIHSHARVCRSKEERVVDIQGIFICVMEVSFPLPKRELEREKRKRKGGNQRRGKRGDLLLPLANARESAGKRSKVMA